MNKKLKLHSFFYSNVIVISSFVIIAIMSGILLWHYKYIPMGADAYFQTQRLYELRMSFLHGDFFPQVMLNGFKQNGVAIMAMYPQFGIVPLVMLSYFFKSVISFVYVSFIIRNLISLNVAFFSSYLFNKNRKISYLFSLSYTLSSTVLCYAINGYDIGRTATLIFIPMVMFGFLEMLKNKRWIEFSVGMTAMIFCHVINTAIVIIFIMLMILFNIRQFNDKNVIRVFIKSIAVTSLTTSVFWIPFVKLSLLNEINIPSFWSTLQGIDFNHFISSSLNNNVDPSTISLIAMLGLFLGVLYYKKMEPASKKIFLISIIFLAISSQAFPWNILNHTFIKDCLQFPWRFLIIPQMILCYLFSEIIIDIISKRNKEIDYFFITIISIFSLNISNQESIIQNTINNPRITSAFSGNANVKIYDNKDFNNVLFGNFGMVDYYPKPSVLSFDDISNQVAVDSSSERIKVDDLGDGKMSFSAIRKSNITLPFMYYKGINYEVKLDGKKVNWKVSSRQLIVIKDVRKGKHEVQIIIHRTLTDFIAYLFSTVGIIILIFSLKKK